LQQTGLSLAFQAPLALAAERRYVGRGGARGLSGFVARAIAHELEREQLGSFLAELEERRGSVSKSNLAAAKRAWLKL